MNIKNLFIDRKFRLPRIWSNKELRKFAHLFTGDIINVSAWKDIDKEGNFYKDYFINKKTYTITNYDSDKRGLQGIDGEIYLDLEKDLPKNMYNKYDVVFNHTTLEHIYNFKKAFQNLCLLSKDIVIVIVPFLQEMHSSYGDYWRFTPLSLQNLFYENGFEILYLSFNSHRNASIYIFTIASKNPKNWINIIPKFIQEFSPNSTTKYMGSNIIRSNCINQFIGKFIRIFDDKKFF